MRGIDFASMVRGGSLLLWLDARDGDLGLGLISDGHQVQCVGMQVFLRDRLHVSRRNRADDLWITIRVVEPQPVDFGLQHETNYFALAIEFQRKAPDQVPLGIRQFSVADRLSLNIVQLLQNQPDRLVGTRVLGLQYDDKSTGKFSRLKYATDRIGQSSFAPHYLHQVR